MRKRIAKLRTCASCEWIFEGGVECPKCQFGSYGAHSVYGKDAYKFKKTQHPWMEKKMTTYSCQLYSEIMDSQEDKDPMMEWFNTGKLKAVS